MRNSRTKRVSAASPNAQSSSVIDSSGLWLMPPLQRTNSMPAGQSAAHDHRVVPRPRRDKPGLHADLLDRTRQPRDDERIADEGAGLVGFRDGRGDAPRRGDRMDARASESANAAARRESSGARRSMENWTCPGMTLVAPGQTSSRPTVATRSASRARAPRSPAPFRPPRSARRGAAPSASRRRGRPCRRPRPRAASRR